MKLWSSLLLKCPVLPNSRSKQSDLDSICNGIIQCQVVGLRDRHREKRLSGTIDPWIMSRFEPT